MYNLLDPCFLLPEATKWASKVNGYFYALKITK